METIKHLRHETEDDAAEAITSVGAALPIADMATLAIVLGRMLGGPVTEDDVGRVLLRSYFGLPIETPAAVLEAFNRHLDVVLGEDPASAEDAGDEEGHDIG